MTQLSGVAGVAEWTHFLPAVADQLTTTIAEEEPDLSST